MTSFLRSDRSRAVAVWLFITAAMVVAMVVVGGATRLTDSGLSITEWKPITGAIPPLSQADWQAEFARYQAIPQFRLVNPDMDLAAFKSIYWWEWSHRLLGRLLGLVFAAPLIWFAIRREIPRRLMLRLAGIAVLGGLQGVAGWWMVASGLVDRVSVAPERLMIHLGLAFALLGLVPLFNESGSKVATATASFLDIAKIFAGAIVGSTTSVALSAARARRARPSVE